MSEVWRVYYRGEWPQKKRVYIQTHFSTRRKARNWCRNHRYEYEGLTIVGPKSNQVEKMYED
jgi:arsenate reductase-like glutaredoxin family protein